MPTINRTYWPDPARHVHVLGEVRRVQYGSGRISALYLYDQSVIRGSEPIELPPARIRAMIGLCRDIRCTICDAKITWEDPPTEAYLRLMASISAPLE